MIMGLVVCHSDHVIGGMPQWGSWDWWYATVIMGLVVCHRDHGIGSMPQGSWDW